MVDETSVLMLKRVGPKGTPGMPKLGAAPIPRKVLQKGVKDMVRISDARMSGTSYGTVVLHVSPEAEAGGPLALVKDGDEIDHVLQAHEGCDFDFLRGKTPVRAEDTAGPSHS